jgi:16S rRNA (adenine1518-N6/adenine1519-N6)-dimethyltransferase
LTVEIDQNLHRLASQELSDKPNVKLIHGDALHNKNTLQPFIMDNIDTAMAKVGEQARFLLVANLPYNVATPIISNLLRERRPPDAMVVTIQKELADRMVAVPSTKDYSALSIWLQSLCDIEIVRILSPKVFWPQPKVHSAIVRLDLDRARMAAIPDLEYYHQTIRSLFFHRRKFLRSVVISAMKGRLEKAVIDPLLDELGHDANVRAEQLTIEQLQTLVEKLRVAENKAA